MNWYFLGLLVSRSFFLETSPTQGADIRDHLGEALQRLLDVCAGCHVVFNTLDKRRIGNASGVGCGVLAVSSLALFIFLFESPNAGGRDEFLPEFDC